MNIKGKYLERSAYIWIYSAVIIFLLGFLKWFIAIPSAAAAVYALFLVFRNEKDDSFYVSVKMLVAGALIVIAYMLLCGQGGFFPQLGDWVGHNAKLDDLVNYSWPVYYSDGSAYTYYIGHFIIPGFFGRLFGLGFARAVLMVYTSAGVYLIWLYLVKILKADRAWKQLVIIFLIMFFGNAENIRNIVTDLFVWLFHINHVGIIHNFTTNFNSFGGVFNQITCAFLVLGMFFDDDTRIENFIVMGVPLLFFSPFMMCAIIVIFGVGTVKLLVSSKNDIKGFFKRLLSIQNLCILIFVLPVIVMYLSGNIFAEKPDSLKFHFVSYGGRIIAYILFVLCEFMLYSICIYPRFKRNAYFYAANIMLIALPFMWMGLCNDLMTRACSVGLYVLMMYSGDYIINETTAKSRKVRKLILCIIIAIVAIPCMNGYIDNVKSTASELSARNYQKTWIMRWGSLDRLYERFEGDDLKYNFYTYDAKDHFFFKYMARK